MTKSVFIVWFAIVNLSVVNAVATKQRQQHQWGVDKFLLKNKKAKSERERKENRETILFQQKKLEPTCSLDFDTKTYDGACTTKKECYLTVIDKDSHARSAGASYTRHQAGPQGLSKCGSGLSCCADVKCIAGNGHCIDSAKQKCTYKTIGGQCPGGNTVTCCPYAANSVDKWNEKRFENNMKCLGGRGICRFKRLAPCKHAWVRGQCGSGNEVCCPSSATAKVEWENEKLRKKCDFVGPAAKYLKLDITTLMAFIKVESGGSASAIRFECHKFQQHDKVNGKMVPCTIKKGDSFSRVLGESGAKAFKKAYSLNKVAAIKSTSYGLFQVMGGYLLNGIESDPEKALELFEKNPEDVSLQLLILWFSDPRWGAKAATSARQITSADGATDQKHWKELVGRYNGNGQVDYYVGKLQEAYKFYEGKCPTADKYDSKDAFKSSGIISPGKSSGIVSPGEIKVSEGPTTFDLFRSAFPSFNFGHFIDFFASTSPAENLA